MVISPQSLLLVLVFGQLLYVNGFVGLLKSPNPGRYGKTSSTFSRRISQPLWVTQDRIKLDEDEFSSDKWVRVGKSRVSGVSTDKPPAAKKIQPRPKKQKPLVERRGARKLTKKEMKKKEQREAMVGPRVTRVHAPADRISLSDLSVGEMKRGRIIKIESFGMFVDVGSKRDGLVHIKDVSQDYFVQRLDAMFRPGQDVNVWIKYVDSEEKKLALQMFPTTAAGGGGLSLSRKISMPERAKRVEDVCDYDEVEGVVTRVSNFGVFVNIGCDEDAFLHRRKMRIGRKRRAFKPWEIHPVGSSVKGFVHFVEQERGRISLTTYAPELWESMLPAAEERVAHSYDDDEERGGSVRAANLEALKNTLALTLDDEKYEEDEDDDMDTEALARAMAIEDARLLAMESDWADHDDDEMTGNEVMGEVEAELGAPSARGEPDLVAPEGEMSVDDLFSELSGGRGYVTARDVIRWDFVSDLLESGEMDEYFVDECLRQCGASSAGRLKEEGFDAFVGMLAEVTGSEEVYDDDVEALMRAHARGPTDDDASDPATRTSSNTPIQVLMQDDADEDYGIFFEEGGGESLTMSAADAQAAFSKVAGAMHEEDDNGTNDDDDDDDDDDDGGTFLSLNGAGGENNEGYSSDAMRKLGMTSGGAVDANAMARAIFNSIASAPGRASKTDVFAWDFASSLVANGAASDVELESAFDAASGGKDHLTLASFEPFVEALCAIEGEEAARIGDESGMDGLVFADDEDDWESTEEVFTQLSAGRGVITLEALSSWKVVEELVEAGVIAKSGPTLSVEALYNDACADMDTTAGGMDLLAFEDFVDRLLPFATGDDSAEMGVPEALTEGLSGETDIPRASMSTLNMNDDGNDEQDEAELLSGVFSSLAGPKNFVSAKDLLQWDLVMELMGDGLLSEDKLVSMVEGSPGGSKGLDLHAFDALIDSLLSLYEEKPPAVEIADSALSLSSEDVVAQLSDDDDREADGGVLTLGDEGEYFEVDAEFVFEEVARGKDFITGDDLHQWDLVQQLQAQGVLTDTELDELLESAGVIVAPGQDIHMDKLDFEAFLEVLSEEEE